MNTRQKITLAGMLVIVLAALIAWGATGFNIFTKQQIPVEQIDEFFGTKVIVWKDVFMVGLDIAGTVVLATLVIGSVLFYAVRTRRTA